MATSDSSAALARSYHRASLASEQEADQARRLRNRLILQLREEDPLRWTYGALARAVGCSPELIAAIVRGRNPRNG